MTDRVPSPLHARTQSRSKNDGKGVGTEAEVPTHLVATSCFLSCNQRKSEMKSKCCVYVRMASCFRGSHNFDSPAPARVLNFIATGRTARRLLTLTVPSSSPVARKCGVGHTTRLMGALRGILGSWTHPPAHSTHSCTPWRVSDTVPVPVSMVLPGC